MWPFSAPRYGLDSSDLTDGTGKAPGLVMNAYNIWGDVGRRKRGHTQTICGCSPGPRPGMWGSSFLGEESQGDHCILAWPRDRRQTPPSLIKGTDRKQIEHPMLSTRPGLLQTSCLSS